MRRRSVLAAMCAGAMCAALWQPGPARIAAQSLAPPEERYASPLELLLSPDGTRLYVLCQGADEVRVLNSVSGAVLQTIPVGHVPRGFLVVAGCQAITCGQLLGRYCHRH